MGKIVFGHLTLEMLIAFGVGLVSLLAFILAKARDARDGYGVQRFMRPTWQNILFHITSSFGVLMVLHEISGKVIEHFIPQLAGSGTYHMAMSLLTGALGSSLFGWFLEKWAKRRNASDPNITESNNN
ncbi:hypothetical protein [Robiginitalea biformata]|nr:hypothetical protein [Robiginitalea biformata]